MFNTRVASVVCRNLYCIVFCSASLCFSASYTTDTIRTHHTISKWDGAGGMHVGAAGNLYLNCDWDNNGSGHSIYFGTNGSFSPTVLMRIRDNGLVGIGTTSPSERLTVNGNVACDTVKASVVKINNWTIEAPDYVFSPSYRVRSLPEVETFIKANSHLPDVPSAADMKTNGVDLAELNMILLKKIEELTIYTLQQDKRLSEIEAILNAAQGMAK